MWKIILNIYFLDFAGPGFGGGGGFGGGFGGFGGGGFKRSLERRMDTAKKQIEGKRIHWKNNVIRKVQ